MKLNWSLIILCLVAFSTGLACYLIFGREVTIQTLAGDVELFKFILPRIGAAMLLAGLVQALIPADVFARVMGEDSGVRGLAVATAAGAATPGGPMTSFPIVTMMRDCGTGRAPLVTYITAWSTLGLQRIFLWELPLMGPGFAAMRFLVSLPLGLIAGLTMRFLPEPPPTEPGAGS